MIQNVSIRMDRDVAMVREKFSPLSVYPSVSSRLPCPHGARMNI